MTTTDLILFSQSAFKLLSDIIPSPFFKSASIRLSLGLIKNDKILEQTLGRFKLMALLLITCQEIYRTLFCHDVWVRYRHNKFLIARWSELLAGVYCSPNNLWTYYYEVNFATIAAYRVFTLTSRENIKLLQTSIIKLIKCHRNHSYQLFLLNTRTHMSEMKSRLNNF